MTTGVVGRGGVRAIAGGGRRAGLRAAAALIVGGVWSVARVVLVPPATSWWVVLGGFCQVLAWGLVTGLIALSVGRLAGWAPAGWLGGLGALAYGVWLHRLPDWAAPGLVDRFLGRPWLGAVRWPPPDWPAAAATAWIAGVTLADILVALVIGTVAWRRWARARTGTGADTWSPPARRHLVAAVAVVVVLAALVASLSGPVQDTGASAQAAGAFLAAYAVPMSAAALLGLAGIGRRPDARAVAALFLALGLDLGAGLAGSDPWTGPVRLGVPWGGAGQQQTTMTTLALAGITATVCGCLLSVAPVARLLQSLQDRPGLAAILILTANTIDAVATQAGLRNGTVAEANPAVRLAGMTVKWVVVTVLVLALFRLHPRGVWIVTAVYLIVVAYHLLGALLLT